MKKTAILLMAFTLIGIVNAANLVVDGNFENGLTGWTRWNAGGSNAGDHSGDYEAGTPYTNDLCVWTNDGGIEQTITGITTGTYVLSADFIKSTTWPLINATALVKVEMSRDGVFWWSQEININATAPSSVWQNKWVYITVANNEFGQAANRMRVIAMLWRNAGGGGNAYIDNISIEKVVHQAYNPAPSIDEAVDPTLNTVTWTKPDPNRPGDTVTCDVWLRESATQLSDPNFIPANAGLYKISSGQTANSKSVTLNNNKYYYWRVDCMDPGVGTTTGQLWKFNTGDIPPVANAGSDQYVWLTMNDGTPADGKVTVTLSGAYIDDGKSPVTTLWSVGTKDPADAVITIANPTAATTTATIDRQGWYQFVFAVSDGASTRDNDMYVGVYDSACTAAKADPTDIAARFPNGNGDINGDCVINLSDFAILAQTWLDCMSAKMNCVP